MMSDHPAQIRLPETVPCQTRRTEWRRDVWSQRSPMQWMQKMDVFNVFFHIGLSGLYSGLICLFIKILDCGTSWDSACLTCLNLSSQWTNFMRCLCPILIVSCPLLATGFRDHPRPAFLFDGRNMLDHAGSRSVVQHGIEQVTLHLAWLCQVCTFGTSQGLHI